MDRTTAWRSRPVFITSTFLDMQAERDFLRDRVFPELEEWLRVRRQHLEWIDLRAGVRTSDQESEDAREMQVLKVCLTEVERSRPFIVGLIGDRYGWVPPPARAAAAAREAGLAGDVAGRSVTDLEIEFGILADPEQRRRCFFYFREPLPYGEMRETAGDYSEEFARADPDAPRKARALAELKARIRREFPDRCRSYAAQWTGRAVTGFEELGRMVAEDIRRELDAETAGSTAGADLLWQESEREAAIDFAEDRARDFVGRDDLLNRIESFLASPSSKEANWGLCLAGSPGSGKSAVFGELCRRLGAHDPFVLFHAASASPRALSVDFMLRRWIHELGAELGGDPALDENADAELVDNTFASLLGRVAANRRVVVLADGLDQFEQTARGRFATWVPRLWPANARLVATAIPGSASASLAERAGCDVRPMPELDRAEARAIVTNICRRYHREFEDDVIDALLRDGTHAIAPWTNPLWAVLAAEELNLIDADDFATATRDYAHFERPVDRLHALLLDRALEMPATVFGLYRASFEHAEMLFGATFTRAFLGMIAAGRAGWRESDFHVVLPGLAGEGWDPLRFAALRRLFRAQVRQRGALGQWDFAHAQMRQAAREWLEGNEPREAIVHDAVANHLLALPREDALHIEETMVHLMECSNWAQRAARYYGGVFLTKAEAEGATRALARIVLAAPAADPAAGAERVVRLLAADTNEPDRVPSLADRFIYSLEPAIRDHATLDARAVIAAAAAEALARLPDDQLSRIYRRDLSVARNLIGDVEFAQGNLAAALRAYRDGLSVRERSAREYPGEAGLARDLFQSWNRIGDVLVAQGHLGDALKAFSDARSVADAQSRARPDDLGWQRDLAFSLSRIGEIHVAQGNLGDALTLFQDGLAIDVRLTQPDPKNTAAEQGLAASWLKIGDVLRALGNLTEALAMFLKGLAIAERQAFADPGNLRTFRDLSAWHNRIGDVFVTQGRLTEAYEHFIRSQEIAERTARSDPRNAGWQRDLVVSHQRIGDVLAARGQRREALQSFRAAREIAERLTHSDPHNADWQSDLLALQGKIAEVLTAEGQSGEAAEVLRDAHAGAARLAANDPSNAERQRDVSVALLRNGDVLSARGKLADALKVFREALEISEGLARAEPDSLEWQRDQAVLQGRIGEILVRQGKPSEALRAFREDLAIAERLARIDAANAIVQEDVWICWNRIGEILATQGQVNEALKAFRSSLDIARQVAQKDPGNGNQQMQVAILSHRIGVASAGEGRLDEAVNAFRESIAILERLRQTDPANADVEANLSNAQSGIGDALAAQGKFDEALMTYRECLTTNERLAQREPGNPLRQRNVHVLCDKIGDVLVERRQFPDALKMFRDAHAITERLTRGYPGNAEYQRDLCGNLYRMAQACEQHGDRTGTREARVALLEAIDEMDRKGMYIDEALADIRRYTRIVAGR